MGYYTSFDGELEFDQPVPIDLIEYVNKFGATRRMKRDPEVIKKNDPDWENNCFKGNLGEEGEFYIGDDEKSIIDYNGAPSSQYGLWCDWTLQTDKGITYLVGPDDSKFYEYAEWLQYYIDNFFKPEGLHLSGQISFIGEEREDSGIIDIIQDDDGNDHVRMTYYEEVLNYDTAQIY